MSSISAELMTALEVANLFGTTPLKITKAIHDGKLPIGFVVEPDPGSRERTRTIIVRKRLERYLNGDDLVLVSGVRKQEEDII